MIKLLLVLVLVTQSGCIFAATMGGSFLGHLGAYIIKEEIIDKEKPGVSEKKEIQ
tara:strand:- start:295 stop:459 length:165 start_codon:yes stop_codon:yes gene_type:complete